MLSVFATQFRNKSIIVCWMLDSGVLDDQVDLPYAFDASEVVVYSTKSSTPEWAQVTVIQRLDMQIFDCLMLVAWATGGLGPSTNGWEQKWGANHVKCDKCEEWQKTILKCEEVKQWKNSP